MQISAAPVYVRYLRYVPLTCSFLLHILIFLSAFFFLQSRSVDLNKIAQESIVVVLDALQITDSTNLKLKDTAVKEDKYKGAQKKFATVVTDHSSETLTGINNVEIPTNKQQNDNIDEKAPKIIKKPSAKPKSEVQPEEKKMQFRNLREDDELAGLLQSLDDKTTGGSVQNTGEGSGFIGKGEAFFDDQKPVGVDVISSIRSQFIKCWNVPIAAIDLEKIIVVINIELDEEGRVLYAGIEEGEKYINTFEKVLAESALRAVHLCSPIKNLPKDRFSTWRKMQLRFSTADML